MCEKTEEIIVRYDGGNFMFQKLDETDHEFNLRMENQRIKLMSSLTEEDKKQFEALKKLSKNTKIRPIAVV